MMRRCPTSMIPPRPSTWLIPLWTGPMLQKKKHISTTGRSFGRVAKCSGAPVPSTIWRMFAGIAMILISGKPWETKAGATRMCCPTSRRRKTGNAGPQLIAAKEVILSGGAINSPQLLMLSGVGPGEHLQKFGIRVVADVAGVGENLHDHPIVYTYYTTKPSFSAFGGSSEGNAFVKTQADLPEPDLQLLFAPFFFPPVLGNGYTVVVVLATPQSRGRLTLRSPDPTQHPAIFANYLAKQEHGAN